VILLLLTSQLNNLILIFGKTDKFGYFVLGCFGLDIFSEDTLTDYPIKQMKEDKAPRIFEIQTEIIKRFGKNTQE
jgi:hypothetical protein